MVDYVVAVLQLAIGDAAPDESSLAELAELVAGLAAPSLDVAPDDVTAHLGAMLHP